MIDAEKRQAILTLHTEGVSNREISLKLRLSRNTVREILKGQGGKRVTLAGSEAAITIDPQRLSHLYADCDGWVQRVHEILITEGVKVGYSTLTRLIRKQGLGTPAERRHPQVETVAGAEMQHDTSVYRIAVGSSPAMTVVASLLYYRYSKARYLRFYPSFTRFQMKCFFSEALRYYRFTAPICVIDNTNLAVHHGTGKNAVFNREMEEFARSFGFRWLAHEKGHSNRKAGEERSFWTVETNFFPGRKFASLEDLNEQARHWALEIMAKRPQTELRIIPAEWFLREKPYLKKIPPYVAEPYLEHRRGIDQYGYAPFEANSYWVPGSGRGQVMILQYSEHIRIYRDREMLVEYKLPIFGTKHKKFKPDGAIETKIPTIKASPVDLEEAKLRSLSPSIGLFLDFALAQKHMRGQRPRLIHELYRLQARMARTLFVQTIDRAMIYGVSDPAAIERIAIFLLRDDLFDAALPETPSKYQGRDTYREGRLSADPDLSIYQDLLNITDEDGEGSTDETGDLS